MDISPESPLFQVCQFCEKVFTQNHPYKRHISYCRRAQSQRKGRPKSCTTCRAAKAKCTFGQPCLRCQKKNVRCVYQPPGRNIGVSSAEQVQEDESGLSEGQQFMDCLVPSESLDASHEPNDAAADCTSPITTWPASNSVWVTDTLGMSTFDPFGDLRINIPRESLSVKGDLTRVSNRLSSLQHASRLIMQMIYAYPQMMLRRQTFPPFIHPRWHQKHLPEALGNCMSIAQLFAARTPETGPFLWKMIDAEEGRFREKLYTFPPQEVHLCLQVMIIYMIMAMAESKTDSKERLIRLLESVELIGSRFLELTGNYTTSEASEPSRTWESWIFSESRRRMACLWLIISCVITIEAGRSCSGCGAMESLPLPSSKALWEARTLEEWQTEKAFFDVSCPVMTLGELVAAKENVENLVGAQKLQSWEMGSDKLAAMLDIAVEFVWGRSL